MERERRSAPRPGPYRPAEVDDTGADATADALLTLGLARDLERVAVEGVRGPSARLDPAFVDRVMAAVAREPRPAPIVALRSLRGEAGLLRLPALAGVVGDAFRVAVGPGRPFASRAPALAFAAVMVAVVGLGALGGLSLVGLPVPGPGASLPGVGGMPAPSVEPSPPPATPSPAPAIAVPLPPTVAPSPVGSPPATARPIATPAPTPHPPGTSRPSVRPTTPPTASPSPHPTETSDGSHSAEPSGTPEPSSTPESTSGSGG